VNHPGFDIAKHIGYDVMHIAAGLVKDSAVGVITKRRWKDWVREFEVQHNNNRFSGHEPFAANMDELACIEQALLHIVDTTDSRIAGSRVARLLHSSKKNKSHTMSLMGSDFGK
jgi:hypothetical protein